MKTYPQAGLLQNCHSPVTGRQIGFTRVELLVVIAVIAILAVLLLSAILGSARRQQFGTRCASNLKQLTLASIVYGDDFGKLPPWQSGMGDKENDMRSDQNSLWVYSSAPKDRPPMSFRLSPGASFQNLGYVYPSHGASEGSSFFCPARKTGPYSAGQYSPLLTCDRSGAIRSSYYYNPRMINADPALGPVNTHRRFLKSTDLASHRKVFGMDVITDSFAHDELRGWIVAFTDGSARFCRGTGPGMDNLIKRVKAGDILAREQIFDNLEAQ